MYQLTKYKSGLILVNEVGLESRYCFHYTLLLLLMYLAHLHLIMITK